MILKSIFIINLDFLDIGFKYWKYEHHDQFVDYIWEATLEILGVNQIGMIQDKVENSFSQRHYYVNLHFWN